MAEVEWIRIDQFCKLHNVELSLIRELRNYELIEITVRENTEYLSERALRKAETVIGMYYELNVNPEGIDIILRLLKRLQRQEEELKRLQNRLRRFE